MTNGLFLEADLHTHTVASTHAFSTITENCEYASQIGVKCIALTDHGMAMPDSPHVWHFENMRVLPRKIRGVSVLKGVEANILDYDGNLDVPEKHLANIEWLVASYHRYYFENFAVADKKTVTEGYLKLFERYGVDLVGHPTTKNFPADWDILAKAAAERGILLELNESSVATGKSPRENVLAMLSACKKYGCEIAVDSDAHFWSAIGSAPLSSKLLEEADFPTELIVNADIDRLRERVHKKHPEIEI